LKGDKLFSYTFSYFYTSGGKVLYIASHYDRPFACKHFPLLIAAGLHYAARRTYLHIIHP